MAFWQWSKTAATNASIDATVNFAEGQAPSTVNDSARAVMARLAEYRDDTSGLLVSAGTITSGTCTNFTLTTNQGLASVPNDGQTLTLTAHAQNAANAKLAVDGGTNYPFLSSTGNALPAFSLAVGTPYTVKFSLANLAWMTTGYYNEFNGVIPIGGSALWWTAAAPTNWVFANGQVLSQTTFAQLFNAIGTTYNIGGEGGGNFRVPNVCEIFLLGMPGMGGVASRGLYNAGTTPAGPALQAYGSTIYGEVTHQLSIAELASHNHPGSAKASAASLVGAISNGTLAISDTHSHQYSAPSAPSGAFQIGSGAAAFTSSAPTQTSGTNSGAISIAGGVSNGSLAVSDPLAVTVGAQGGNGGHNNVPQNMGVGVIIRAF